MRTTPTFAASGQKGSVGVNSGTGVPGSNSPKPLKPAAPSEHASSPFAADGLSRTPWGSVRVVAFTAAAASPLSDRVDSWFSFTSTVSPLGVLPACVPGITLNSKANGSASQPSSGWVAASASEALSAKTPGALHESVRADAGRGVHDVGSARNAVSGRGLGATQCGSSACEVNQTPAPTQSQPRS